MPPVRFFQEELGLPESEAEALQALDDQASVKEITRLTSMEVVELVHRGQEEEDIKYLTKACS